LDYLKLIIKIIYFLIQLKLTT